MDGLELREIHLLLSPILCPGIKVCLAAMANCCGCPAILISSGFNKWKIFHHTHVTPPPAKINFFLFFFRSRGWFQAGFLCDFCSCPETRSCTSGWSLTHRDPHSAASQSAGTKGWHYHHQALVFGLFLRNVFSTQLWSLSCPWIHWYVYLMSISHMLGLKACSYMLVCCAVYRLMILWPHLSP